MCDKFWICNMSAKKYLVQPFYMDDGVVPDDAAAVAAAIRQVL